MSLYKRALSTLLKHESVGKWPELRAVMERAATKEPISWNLPILVSQAVGGSEDDALPAVTAYTCVHMSILLIDDLLDKDPRGEHHKIGEGRAANLAAALISLSTSILLDELEDERAILACKALADMQLTLCHGQDMDTQNHASEKAYWQVTHGKSAVFFGTSFFLGALYGGASIELTKKLQEFGENYGEIMQIHDDLNDCLANPANPDWVQGRFPLPILFATLVEHPEREAFIQLRKEVDKPEALEKAQAILVSSGAISYSVSELVARHSKAKTMLDEMTLVDPKPLEALLDEVIAPVERLLTAVGADLASISS